MMGSRRGSKMAISPMLLAGVASLVFAAGGATAYVALRAKPAAPEIVEQRPAAATPPAAPAEPQAPRLVVEHGVRFEDDDVVKRFLGQGVYCWDIRGQDLYATVFDMMRERSDGSAGPLYVYQTSHERRDSYDYVVIKETVLKHDGTPMPLHPGAVVHTYYYDPGPESFQYMDSRAEDPDYDPSRLKDLPPPTRALAMFREAICPAKLSYPDVKQMFGIGPRVGTPAAPDTPSMAVQSAAANEGGETTQ